MLTRITKLTEDFRRSLESRPKTNGRYPISAKKLDEYINAYLGLAANAQFDLLPEINCKGLYVEGSISFPPGNYPSINFNETIFHGDAVFEEVTFGGVAVLSNVTQTEKGKIFQFVDVAFSEEAIFRSAKIPNCQLGPRCDFHKAIYLSEAKIHEISNATFHSEVEGSNCEIDVIK